MIGVPSRQLCKAAMCEEQDIRHADEDTVDTPYCLVLICAARLGVETSRNDLPMWGRLCQPRAWPGRRSPQRDDLIRVAFSSQPALQIGNLPGGLIDGVELFLLGFRSGGFADVRNGGRRTGFSCWILGTLGTQGSPLSR